MVTKKLTAIGYVVRRDGAKIKRGELSIEEQKRLAEAWCDAAMKAAGYVPAKDSKRRKEVT